MCGDYNTQFTPAAGLLEGGSPKMCRAFSHLKLDLGFLLGDLQDLGGIVRAPQAFFLHEHLARTAGNEPAELGHAREYRFVGRRTRAPTRSLAAARM